MKKGILLFASLFLVFISFGQSIIYVSKDGNNSDGSSWTNAYTDLQTALSGSVSGDKILVANGVYTPHASDRTVSFKMKAGVKVYGGFAGTEDPINNEVYRNRDFKTNETVLSGDLNQDDLTGGDNSENSYTVVHFDAGSAQIDQQTILDGFTVSGGNSDDEADWSEKKYGGGIFFEPASSKDCAPVLQNLIIKDNEAFNGAGVYVYTIGNVNASTSPEFYNVIFLNNYASDTYGTGGAAFIRSSENNPTSPKFVNCLFNNNTAMSSGGAVYILANGVNRNTTATFTNCTFINNKGIYVEKSQVYNTAQNSGNCTVYYNNCIVWGSTGNLHFMNFVSEGGTLSTNVSNSLIKGSGGTKNWNTDYGIDGGGNKDEDPKFINLDGDDLVSGTLDDNLHVQEHSPLLDAGSDLFLPEDAYDIDFDGNTSEIFPIDLEGNSRITNNNSAVSSVNMGAHETGEMAYVNPWPEPSNWVTNFAASTLNDTTVQLTWTASVGEQLPHKYLILAKKGVGQTNAPYIEDGSYFSERDFNPEDDYAIVTMDHKEGEMSYTFENLMSDKYYSFNIYPFTNEMAETDYVNYGLSAEVWLGNIKAEPSNHVTDLDSVIVSDSAATISWTGSVGGVLPDGYLIVGFEGGGYLGYYLEDGSPQPDDADWSDGNWIFINVPHQEGLNEYAFNNLKPNTIYNFSIYPYTNNDEDIDYKTSDEVPVTVFRTKYFGPVITVQPEVKVLQVGEDLTLSIGATGDNLTYQWLKDELEISEETDTFFNVSGVSQSDMGTYYCTVSNDNGMVTSDKVFVFVYEGDFPVYSMTRGTHAPKPNDTLQLESFDLEVFPEILNGGAEIHWNITHSYYGQSNTGMEVYRDTSGIAGHPEINMYSKKFDGEGEPEMLFIQVEDTGYYWKMMPGESSTTVFDPYLTMLEYPFTLGSSFTTHTTFEEEGETAEISQKVTGDAYGKVTLPYKGGEITINDVFRVKSEMTYSWMGIDLQMTRLQWFMEEYNHYICELTVNDSQSDDIIINNSILDQIYVDEPLNHVDNIYVVDSTETEITISWDYSEESVPDAYLVRAIRFDGGPVAVEEIKDGEIYNDNLTWEYAVAYVNVEHQGAQNSYTFDNLMPGKNYNFQVYPYNKSEHYRNYQTSEMTPYVSATTLKPEPAEHVTDLSAERIGQDVTVTWKYPESSLVNPDKFLVVVYNTLFVEDYTILDGPVPISKDYSNGLGIASIDFSPETMIAVFTGIDPGQFKVIVIPYNEGGETYADFKTDGTIPSVDFSVESTTKALEIVSQPLSKTVQVGDHASLNVLITDTDEKVIYQWYKNGEEISSGTDNQISFNQVTLLDAGEYYCVVNGENDTLISETAVLTVLEEVPKTFSLTEESHLPAGGDAFTQMVNQFSTNVNYYESGYNMIWDLSGIEYENDTWETSIAHFKDTSGLMELPTANLVMFEQDDNGREVFNVCDSGLYHLGSIYDGNLDKTTPYLPYLKVPLTCSNETNVFTARISTSPSPMDVNFTVKTNAYGSLVVKVPGDEIKTIANTIRVHEHIVYEMDAMEVVADRYRWFVSDYKFPVLEIMSTGMDDLVEIRIDQSVLSTQPNPEPENHVTNLSVIQTGSNNVKLEWNSSAGNDLPDYYLVVAMKNTVTNIPTISDGNSFENNADWSDGICYLNVAHKTGLNNATFTGLESGVEYVFYVYPYSNIGVDINYKTDTSVPEKSITIETVGIENEMLSFKVRAYPNPASDVLFIEINNQVHWSLEMYDVYGKMIKCVQSISTKSHELNVSELEQGLYMLRIESDSGSSTLTIVIQ